MRLKSTKLHFGWGRLRLRPRWGSSAYRPLSYWLRLWTSVSLARVELYPRDVTYTTDPMHSILLRHIQYSAVGHYYGQHLGQVHPTNVSFIMLMNVFIVANVTDNLHEAFRPCFALYYTRENLNVHGSIQMLTCWSQGGGRSIGPEGPKPKAQRVDRNRLRFLGAVSPSASAIGGLWSAVSSPVAESRKIWNLVQLETVL